MTPLSTLLADLVALDRDHFSRVDAESAVYFKGGEGFWYVAEPAIPRIAWWCLARMQARYEQFQDQPRSIHDDADPMMPEMRALGKLMHATGVRLLTPELVIESYRDWLRSKVAA